jgi:hypothetical protein
MALNPYSYGKEHLEKVAQSRIHGKARTASNRRRYPSRGNLLASYKVAKKVIEFEYQEEIPRSRLRAAYGDGFKGAPLRCESSSEARFSQDAGIHHEKALQALSTISQENNAIRGACHV